tara:strand:+ start:1623 stop:1751 length:129 start_codon:yes stop_codon:yes gene_type:complete
MEDRHLVVVQETALLQKVNNFASLGVVYFDKSTNLAHEMYNY